MRIGYACITLGVPGAGLRTTIQKYATGEKLRELIASNFAALAAQVEYNLANGITMFRISSELVPFGSSPVNTLDWAEEFAAQLAAIGERARAGGMRLSMHPGQYTVLNSPNGEVVERAVEDLRYHTRLLDALGMGPENKIILHIGGVYGDKAAAIERFCQSYEKLDAAIKARLVIENDDKMYCVQDVLAIGRRMGIPVVFDNLHNQVCPSPGARSEAEWISLAGETWGGPHGVQKTHYSQQAAGKKAGSHSQSIEVCEFLRYADALPDKGIDIMLEVKDKNLSAVKCVNCVTAPHKIALLEREWALYKYTVLERAPAVYKQIRELLKGKTGYPAEAFYVLLQNAMEQQPTTGTAANAAQHVWGYCRQQATKGEAASFAKALAAFTAGNASPGRVKGLLKRLAAKYNQAYLLNSYYFML